MILKASERGNASNLARHLMNASDNEHVDVHGEIYSLSRLSGATGGLNKVRLQNAVEVAKADERHRAERQAMIAKQLSERRALQKQIKALRASQQNELSTLGRDAAHYMLMGGKAPMEVTKTYENDKQRVRKLQRERDKDRPQGPDFDL